MEAIKFENIRFSYETDEDEAQGQDVFALDTAFALDGVNFTVQEGEFVAVLGHNGSGKSTLARLCNGLLEPTEGQITVLGMDAGDAKNLFQIRKSVGIVFQNPDNQTVASIVEDDIAFGPENVGLPREEIGRRIDFALKAVGMEEFRYATTSRLSGGQKQRIAIAGVLALKPKVMILDEATAMLDPRGRKEVMDVVLRLNREENITVLLITHFPEEALLADRAIVMREGKIVMEGAPQEILKREEELLQSSLTLPRSVKICRELTKNGLLVADAYTPSGVAENIEIALKERGLAGAGTRLIVNTDEKVQTETVGDVGEIVCKNLSFTYNAKSVFATHALNGVDLDIPAGEFFGIIGHTGSGKSTFVQHLNALIKLPTAEKKYKEKRKKNVDGQEEKTVLKVDGFDLTQKSTDFRALRKSVGMVFQYPEYQLFAETVFEDVAFGLRNFSDNLTEEEIESAVKAAIERVGLSYNEVKERSPFELSGGQRRRVAIAGVIVTKPEILILDEPAAGLDPLGKEEIMRLLHSLHRNWCKTVIIVSHDMDEIAENCSLAAIFSEGKILACGTPKTLFSTREITDCAGLDVPFTAKVIERLRANGVEIDSDFTTADFMKKILSLADLTGTGTRSTPKGGQENA